MKQFTNRPNEEYKSYVKIQKTDAESGLAIPYAGAAFQLYNPDGTKISMEFTYPEHTVIDTFYTNEDGYLITPETLEYGKDYYLVEVKAPYGYVLNSDPVYFDVTADDATDEGGLTIVNVTRSNMPQKGVIHITKTGEVFQSVVMNDQMHKPVYEVKNLSGAVFEIRAAEDIYTLDGVMHYAKGELVDTITTGSDGIATSKELYLGKYDIQEVTAPHSMVLNGKVQTVELVYAGQEISITETSGNLYNERQKVKVSLEKALEQNELFGIGMNAELKNITFGLYAQTDIVAADGTKIPEGGLIEIIAFDENGKAVISTDLPLGSYYVQERSTDDHYILSDEKFGFEFTYGDQTVEIIELAVNNGAAIENELKYGSVSGLKVDEDGKVIKGAVFGLFSNDEKSILLVIAMLCVLCFPVQVMAETQQGTNGDELQLMEAQKLEIQLGAEWAGVEFQLKTDAGLYPGTVVVGQDGVLRTEIGGSSTYILTCLNSAVEVPEPTQDSATTEKPDTENQSGTDEAEEGGATVAGIPVLHIVLFGGGMVVAVGALIAMHVVKKRRESDSAYDDDEDE